MTVKPKSRHGIRGNNFKLSPTTRAIRNALALSLAMAASNPALAGTCDVSDPSNAVCNGIFTGSNISFAIDDLTIVVGDDLATVINPLAGYAGIDLYSANGSISLTTAADIVSSYAAAISVNAPNGDAHVTNSGSLQTSYADGIKVRSYDGDVTVSNAGSVDVDFGQRGIEARSGNGDITVDNAAGASISVANAYGNAIGMEARSYYGDISVGNEGVIDVSVVSYGNATGINAAGFMGDVSVTNAETGSITATANNNYGGKATGISAGSYVGGSSVNNAGSISASTTAQYGYNAIATGVRNRGGYYGVTSTVNDGTISSTATNVDGVAWAFGINSRGQNAEIHNSGEITADAYANNGYASATASYVRGGYYGGTSSTTNTGDITAHAIVGDTGQALSYGAMTWGGDVSVDNQGDIAAYAKTANGTAVAMGTQSHYNNSVTLNNDGNIHSDAYAGVGYAESMGSYNYALDVSTVTNGATGTITAVGGVGNGYAFGYAAWLDSGDLSTLTNYGSIAGNAFVAAGDAYIGDYGAVARSIGAKVLARYGDAYMNNAVGASISARTDIQGDFGSAYAFGSIVQGGNMARLVNNGSISADAYTVSGNAVALGDIAYGSTFAVNLNYGSVSAESTVAGSGLARAIGQYSFGEVATLINEGTVAASAHVGSGDALVSGAKLYGANTAAYNYNDIAASGDATSGSARVSGVESFGVFNSSVLNASGANITASANVVDGDAFAQGLYNLAYLYGANVTNDGSIAATASTANGYATALGALNIAFVGYDAAVTVNSGDISAVASSGGGGTSEAIGVYTYAIYSGSSVDNSGSISASAPGPGGALATGISAHSVYGDAVINNSGDISASAPLGKATGVYAASIYGSAEVINSDTGSILASGSNAVGAVLYGSEVSRLTNYGSIAAIADADYGPATAYGSIAAAGIGVTLNYGSITAEATVANAGLAQAVGALSYGSAATIVNEGSITATAAVGDGDAIAKGAYAYGEFNGSYNYGDIAATASAVTGNAIASGVNSFGIDGSTLYNAGTGSITASAGVVDGTAVAVGSYNLGYFFSAYTTNEGSISATATVSGSAGSSLAGAIGLENVSVRYGDAVIVNNGDISATASGSAGYALAKGVYNVGYLYNAQLTNAGDIAASASNAYGYATAFGVQSLSAFYGDASTANTGTISAIAHVDTGFADATGVDTSASYDGTVSNYGSILAAATADLGLTRAIGITTYVGGAAVTQNFGDISANATAHGYYGYAVAAGASTVVAFGVKNTASMDNHGVINATATADGRRGFAAATGSSVVAKYAGTVNYDSVNVVASAGYTGVAKASGTETSGMLRASTTNHGSISVQAITDQGYSAAHGVVDYAYSQRNANVSTVNYGDINVVAYTAGHADTGYGGFAYAWGVESSGNHYTTVHNAGSITTVADAAFGVARSVAVSLDSRRDGSTLTNDGDIYARASGYTYHAVAVGSDVEARGRLIGATTLNNEGASIIAVATADHGGYAGAIGSGTSVWGIDGKAAVMVNHGDVIAVASASEGAAFATGQHTLGTNDANTFNYGSIIAESEAADGLAVAEGNKIWSFYGDAALVNAASITARADAGATGAAFAYGSTLVGVNSGSTYNGVDGTISADAIGGSLARAFGSITSGGASGVVNHGDIAATAIASGYGDSIATGVAVSGDPAAYQWAFQYFYAPVYNLDASINNTGDINATAIAELGIATATGVNAISEHGSVTVANDGSIAAMANAGTGYAFAAGASNVGYYDSLTTNTGSITAVALLDYGYVRANGVVSLGENVTIDNDGVISATASVELGNSVAVAAYSVAQGFATLTNGVDGSINAVATSGQGVAYSTDAFAYGAFVAGGAAALINNYGSISSEAAVYGGEAIVAAVGATTYAAYGIAAIVNYGDISARAVSESTEASYAFAYGTNTNPSYTGFPMAATTVNAHDISAGAIVYIGNAVSAGATTVGKYAATYNYEGGTIGAVSTAESRGRADAVGVSTYGAYYAHDVNAGSITAYAVAHGIMGEGRFTYGAANATGVEELSSPLGSSALVNYGHIGAKAISLDSDGFFTSGASATGIDQFGKYSAGITNHGDIRATASAELGVVSAYGTHQSSKYGYTASLNNHEGASIIALASSGSASDDYAGGRATAAGTYLTGGNAVEYNSGLISARATVDPNDRDFFDMPSQALAVGSMQTGYHDATLKNYGDIQVAASADFGYATAYGAKVTGAYFGVTHNDGDITAVASADDGNAFAVASYTLSPGVRSFEGCAPDYSACYYSYAGGSVTNDNQGRISAQSRADSGVAYAYGSVAISRLATLTTNSGSITAVANADQGTVTAAGSVSNSVYGQASLDNTGTIIAAAYGGYASATGALVVGSYGDVDSGYYAARVTNAGSITALADGTHDSTATGVEVSGRYTSGVQVLNDVGGQISAAAYGADAAATAVSLYSNGDNTLVNSGRIFAVADGTATGVSLASSGSNTLTNTGSIVAAGTNATRIAVSSSADAVATIDNAGLISGAILTGDFDDTFTNGAGATWNDVGQSNFGAGNNAIYNAGTINLQDATISLVGPAASASLLASPAAVGNQFANTGLVTVSGDNTIDFGLMGVFDNSGTIDFQDGAPDDTLTIAGDFAGDGPLLVDVSGLHGASDVLYVGGSVVNGTHTIDVNLIDVPTTASSAVTVVSVAGNSTAGSFALGNVRYNPANFLALDFDTTLVPTINTGNAAPDTFALGMEVTGLNDTGTLAASVAPGAQSLMASQVGTWRQRMGVIDKISKHGLGLWARLFQNQGSIAPEQAASNFGQGGNFAFDQENSGTEVGVDFAVSDQVSVGLLLAKADGKQDLTGDGVGSSKLDGDTVGAYATWLSPLGFYVDASYRQMSFDARFNSAAGVIHGSGDADTFNLEAGYAWTLQGGLKIEPQVQYTWTQVDSMDAMSGALAQFQVEGGDASTGRLGVMVRKSFGTGTVWTPYASINAVHEFDGENAYSINGNFFGATSTEGTSTLIEGGVSVQTGKLSVFGGFNWQDGGAMQGFGGGQLGVRYAW